ncbi:hypothetical protein CTI12_AA526260 [Artemisia annua]|uniref:Uncharacterized protein n=1 Tax=Artemisia annua TaxID=35608 RepID=A0A2U1L640_ARTAN|nr:hypothetical protein CTI12_AA526260 [Artemisia annua]
MSFTVIPNLSPPSFTRIHHKPSSSSLPSTSCCVNNSYQNHGEMVVQSSVETSPLRVRVSPPEEDPRQEFYVNVGVAVRTLRHDLPLLFSEDLDYGIYRDDITFVDPLNKFTGIDNYKLIFRALHILIKRFQGYGSHSGEPNILIRFEGNLKGVPRCSLE